MARKRRTKAEILAAKINAEAEKLNVTVEQSKGLGDTVEKFLEVTRIAKVAKWLLGEDCKCDERKAKLNELFPYKKPLCLEQTEYEYLNEWFNKKTDKITPIEQSKLFAIHSRIFKVRNEATSCSSCVIARIKELEKVYTQYKEDTESTGKSD
jgi:hypothetical protein